MAREPREQFVLNLLEDNWVAANTFDETPSVVYSRDEAPAKPFIVVNQPDEGPIGGGETGFDGMSGSGGPPHQTKSGTVPVHLFADSGELDNATTGSASVYMTGSADTSTGVVSGGAVEEVYRIVRENSVRPSNPTTGNAPVELLSAGTFNPVPEPDEPATVHYVGSLNYIYWTA